MREFDELDGTTKWYLSRLLDGLKQHFGERLVSLVLYGSRARGTHRPDSDIDVIIIIEGVPRPPFERFAVVNPVEKEVKEEYVRRFGGYAQYLSVIVKSPEQAAYHSPLYLDMTEDAVLVFDRDDFFKDILDAMRRRMAELGSKRVWLKGGWYWILKPDMKWGESVEI